MKQINAKKPDFNNMIPMFHPMYGYGMHPSMQIQMFSNEKISKIQRKKYESDSSSNESLAEKNHKKDLQFPMELEKKQKQKPIEPLLKTKKQLSEKQLEALRQGREKRINSIKNKPKNGLSKATKNTILTFD